MILANRYVCLVLITTFAFLIGACDTKKEERAALLKQKNDIESEIGRLKTKQIETSRNIDSLNSGLATDSKAHQDSTNRQKKLQDELAAYVLENKATAAALAAMGGGAAGVMDKNLDEDTKTAAGVIGAIGLGYCIYYYQDCTDVTAKIIYYGSEIDKESTAINNLSSAITSKKASLEKSKQEYSSVSEAITTKTHERDSASQKHDELICRYCIQ